MSRTYRIAACAAVVAAFGFMSSLGVSSDGVAASGGGKGYHTNYSQVAIHKTCAGYNPPSPFFKMCVKSYPKPDRFQKVVMGGYTMP
jgi:hypothetical protein